MLQHGWKLKTLCYVKEAIYKNRNIVYTSLTWGYKEEMLFETESKAVASRSWRDAV